MLFGFEVNKMSMRTYIKIPPQYRLHNLDFYTHDISTKNNLKFLL
jgi:hypothetical protein